MAEQGAALWLGASPTPVTATGSPVQAAPGSSALPLLQQDNVYGLQPGSGVNTAGTYK